MRNKLIFFIVALFVSTPCLADFRPTLASGTYTASISTSAGVASISEAVPTGSATKGPLALLVTGVYGLRSSLQQNLLAYIQTAAAQAGGSIGVYPVLHGTFTASLAGLTGTYAGYNQIGVGGASTTASINTSFSTSGINVTCTSTISFNNVQFYAAYNPYTGVILNDAVVTYAALNPSTFVSCSSNVDWIPVLGTMLDKFVSSKINAALQSSFSSFDAQLVSTIFPNATGQLGIDGILTPGKFIVAGIDWGAYISNNFATLFTGKSITVSMAEWTHPSPTTGVSEPLDVTIVTPALTVDFSDSVSTLKLSLVERDNYNWEYYCATAGKCTNPL